MLNLLEPIQKKALDLFGQSPLREKFYWTGGTLLSTVYLQHRKSEDLDFFTDKPFTYREVANFAHHLKKELGLKSIQEKKIYDRWEFLINNGEKLRIEFVLYEFSNLKPRKKWYGIFIDSLDDIAANKTMTLFERNTPKDLVDLYFLIKKKKYQVPELLKLAKQKFGLSVNEIGFFSETMKGQKFLSDIRPFLLAKNKKKLIEDIKSYFKKQAALCLHFIID